MKRQRLTDGTGRYFDREAAKAFEENTRWDGRNHISVATGSQWDHERLYRTRKGLWVLHSWSQWQGSGESWEEIDNEHAARWLSINSHKAHEACADEYKALDLDNS